jgi:hypothetical protein
VRVRKLLATVSLFSVSTSVCAIQLPTTQSTSVQSGSDSNSTFEWNVFYDEPHSPNNVICANSPYNGKTYGGFTADDPEGKEATGWLAVTKSFTDLEVNWTSDLNLPAGGPYLLRVTSVGRATAGPEADESSHGHIPPFLWSNLKAKRFLYVYLPSHSNQAKPAGVRRDEWELTTYTSSQYHDKKGSHTQRTPLTTEMHTTGPGTARVVEKFRLTLQRSGPASAKEYCAWAVVSVGFEPLRWELLSIPSP